MKILTLILAGLVLGYGAVSAHEKKVVAETDWVVGFLKEPAFSGEMNAIDLRVSRGGKPVTGLEETLSAEIFYENGTESLPVRFKTRYKEPGSYAAHFLPSKPGNYTFQFKGTIEGKPIRERFSSKDGRFSEVRDAEALRFPR